MLSRNVVTGLIIAALILILLGMNSCYQQRIGNLKAENNARKDEVELGEELVDGLDDLSSTTTIIHEVQVRGSDLIDEVAEERPEDNGEALPRMRRADAAWRATLECLYDGACTDPDVGSAEELRSGGDPADGS